MQAKYQISITVSQIISHCWMSRYIENIDIEECGIWSVIFQLICDYMHQDEPKCSLSKNYIYLSFIATVAWMLRMIKFGIKKREQKTEEKHYYHITIKVVSNFIKQLRKTFTR